MVKPWCIISRNNKKKALTILVASILCAGIPITASASHPSITPQTIHSLTVLSDSEKIRIGDRIANVEDEINRLLPLLTLAEKVSLIHAAGKFHIPAIERLGIHEMWMSDGPHGVRYEIDRNSWAPAGWTNDYSTYLPPLTAVAASWDENMASLHGNVLGAEARHRNKDLILGPGVNLARLPLYGRNFEYMGEDPFLAARLVVPAVKAIQANDVGATVKHFALNTQELNRTGVNANPDERTLREVYLPAFEAAVKQANVHAIMGAYNEFRGTNANQSKHLVKTILKGEWGYQGVLLTDWNVDINTYDAAMNGLDIEMGTDVASFDEYFMAKPLLAMINDGKIPVSVLDDKVARILRVQLSIGMMDKQRLSGERNTDSHRQDARTIATNGVVLLKNDNQILPLQASKVHNLLVLGPNADKRHGFGGGSSEVKALYEMTPLDGLKAKLGDKVNITLMRPAGSQFMPIPNDYLTTRHWTGTPSWQINYYQDAAMSQLASESWIADPQFDAKGQNQSVEIKANIKPMATGNHSFNIKADGQVALFINDKPLITPSKAQSNKIMSTSMSLVAGENYAVSLRYYGDKQATLGWETPNSLYNSESEYLAAAKKADAVIYFGGLSHADDRESIDRPNMVLPGQQDEVISKLLSANPNTIVMMIGGSAVEMPWANKAKALLWGWYGGMEAGNAYADILFGDANPSGKMPITLPKKLTDTAPIALNDYNAETSLYSEGVFIGYRWFEQQHIAPEFPFGHGLSYSQFNYADMRISSASMSGDTPLTVSVNITNTSHVDGAEVVQLYLRDVDSSVPRPIKELKGFNKVWLKAGETQTAQFILTQRDLSFWDVKSNNWLAESGEFEIMLGASVADIKLSTKFNYLTSSRNPD
ncbi:MULTISPECIES: glycoside hydrolase family 3 C-terminal domain-containing protein [Pseudomonadati]|uniref:Glycoside hydrolase family 3 C-terminal domain-containing protein n=1 Tax=Shewanella aestuarii TaxID=1028752 RepID=A0ABT0KW84_9GAMM|nr:glycoside hydrolase family 3 C-terminal domain-containing protein [Shewanella aestuarii]MCL1115708.1 glycoside hydrolase family 3 C-terminal domain-containing protein [Shewanella aestuarii]GGN68388.1 beta-glucosidase [Shewanella aestuarii]